MRYVHLDQNVEYVTRELRLATPNDPDTFVVLRSFRLCDSEHIDGRKTSNLMRDAEELGANGFDASVWEVSRQQLCNRLGVEGNPLPPRKKGKQSF